MTLRQALEERGFDEKEWLRDTLAIELFDLPPQTLTDKQVLLMTARFLRINTIREAARQRANDATFESESLIANIDQALGMITERKFLHEWMQEHPVGAQKVYERLDERWTKLATTAKTAVEHEERNMLNLIVELLKLRYHPSTEGAIHLPGTWRSQDDYLSQNAAIARRPDTELTQGPHPSCNRVLHEVLGNPFRPVTWNPAWLNSGVQGLAEQIYDDRAFDLLPVLGDALEDAGCDNPDVLAHCRDVAEHFRGCWVLQQILDQK